MTKKTRIFLILKLAKNSIFLKFALIETLLLLAARQLVSTTLLFDQIILITVVTIFVFVLFGFLNQRVISLAEIKSLLVMGLLIGNLYSYTLMNIDRSRSFYVLSWIDQDKIQFNDDKLVINVISEEAQDQRAIRQRIVEHRTRGLLKVDESGRIELTSIGLIVLGISEFLADSFELRGWEMNRL